MATHDRTVALAVAITVTITLIVAVILFYLLYRFIISRRLKKSRPNSSFRREVVSSRPHVEFRQQGGAVKGVIVDREGLDVLYLRTLEDGHFSGCFSKVWHNPMGGEVKHMSSSRGDKPSDSESIQEIHLLQEASIISYEDQEGHLSWVPPPLPRISRTPPSPPPTPLHLSGFPIDQPPPPPLPRKPPPRPPRGEPPALPPPSPPPPSPPPPPPPPPPSLLKIKNLKPAAPPPPVKTKGLISPHKPPIPPKAMNRSSRTETPTVENLKENGGGQMKLKPLHWDKVTANADYSMVWNEINDGSFRFDDELMEALFGYTTTSHKSTETSNRTSTQECTPSVHPSAPIFLLDPRKSQNTAIVLKSLAISRNEILDALLEGRGLNTDTLEKLTKICPTQEETTKILQFNGNPTKLADAESFLYHILKMVPTAFVRLNAMHFRWTYDMEILHLKESLQTLELACKELRSGGIFFKLLEAILKAGNRMNAGTARGNAQGFYLSALRRLSDIKSTDGKTTLLYFVVEQVIRSEGKHSLISKNKNSNEEKDREYIMLGLPAVRGLNNDFVNVKRSAAIDYDSFISMCSILTTRVEETKQLMTQFREKSGGFFREMKGFLEECEEELSVVREEEKRVMELVKKTTVYYQAGSSKDNGTNLLQLFVIVKDFLNMVDQVSSEIAKKLEKTIVASAGSSPPLSPMAPRSPMRMHDLQSYFRAQRAGMSSSDSEDDF